MQMGELAAEKEKLQEKLRSLTDSNQRTIRSLEGRIQTLQDDLEVTRSEMKAVQSEYDGYKVSNWEGFNNSLGGSNNLWVVDQIFCGCY